MGTLGGTGGIGAKVDNSLVRASGGSPSSTESWWMVSAAPASSGGMADSVAATCALARTRSKFVVSPLFNRRRTIVSVFR